VGRRMREHRFLWIAVLIVGCGWLFFCDQAWGAQTPETESIVVRINKTPHGITYVVDSKPTDHTPQNDILRALALAYEKHGSNSHTPVVVIADDRVAVKDIWEIEWIAAKVPLDNFRYFVHRPGSDSMFELKMGPAVPLSTRPKL